MHFSTGEIQRTCIGERKDRKEDSERKSKSAFHPFPSKSISRATKFYTELYFIFRQFHRCRWIRVLLYTVYDVRVSLHPTGLGKSRRERERRTVRNDSSRSDALPRR